MDLLTKLNDAKRLLNTIHDIPEASFNLGIIESKKNNLSEAKQLFTQYLNKTDKSDGIFVEYAKDFIRFN